jgi:hypothetical protein
MICQIESGEGKSHCVLVSKRNIPANPRVRREEVGISITIVVGNPHMISSRVNDPVKRTRPVRMRPINDRIGFPEVDDQE